MGKTNETDILDDGLSGGWGIWALGLTEGGFEATPLGGSDFWTVVKRRYKSY